MSSLAHKDLKQIQESLVQCFFTELYATPSSRCPARMHVVLALSAILSQI